MKYELLNWKHCDGKFIFVIHLSTQTNTNNVKKKLLDQSTNIACHKVRHIVILLIYVRVDTSEPLGLSADTAFSFSVKCTKLSFHSQLINSQSIRTCSPFRGCNMSIFQGSSPESAVRKYGDSQITWSSSGMLRLSPAVMRRLFRPTLVRIKQAIGDVLNNPMVSGKTFQKNNIYKKYWSID